MLAFIAIAALATLLVWKIGAPLARFGGALMVVISLVFVTLGDPIAPLLPLFVAGVVVWLAGHFLAAYKNRLWGSRLAENIVIRTPLRYIDPINGHQCRQARRQVRGMGAESGSEHAPVEDRTQIDHFANWEREISDAAAPATPAPTPAPAPAIKSAPERPSRSAVYGKRATKAAGHYAARKVPGGRTVQSAWRFLR